MSDKYVLIKDLMKCLSGNGWKSMRLSIENMIKSHELPVYSMPKFKEKKIEHKTHIKSV